VIKMLKKIKEKIIAYLMIALMIFTSLIIIGAVILSILNKMGFRFIIHL
jgi:hypothetical protein